jgi:hypothetical protein
MRMQILRAPVNRRRGAQVVGGCPIALTWEHQGRTGAASSSSLQRSNHVRAKVHVGMVMLQIHSQQVICKVAGAGQGFE